MTKVLEPGLKSPEMPFWSSVVAMQTKKGMPGAVYHVSDINVRILTCFIPGSIYPVAEVSTVHKAYKSV